MKKTFLLSIAVLIFSSLSCAQFTTKQITKCAKTFIQNDTCIYLRDFSTNFSLHGKNRTWNVFFNSGTIYVLHLCGRKKFIKRAPDAKIGLYKPGDKNFENPINKVAIGDHFYFRCRESGHYIVRIWIKKPVKYGGAVGILYFKGKFEVD